MSNQIFKKKIPNETIVEFLNSITTKNEKYYMINNDAYKKGIFNNKIQEFVESLKTHYHLSKHKYIDRKLTYKSFTTILRQICNYNKISYTSQIKYDKSNYFINYYIYI